MLYPVLNGYKDYLLVLKYEIICLVVEQHPPVHSDTHVGLYQPKLERGNEMNNNINMSIDHLNDLPLPSLSSGGLLAELSIGAYNPQRKDSRITDEVHNAEGASSDSGQYVKRLFPGVKQFGEIKTLEMRARHAHKKLTVPFSDAGQRYLITPAMPKYVETITGLKQQFWEVVEEIRDNYDSILQDVERRHGGTFDSSQYPSKDYITRMFKFHHALVPVPEMNGFDKVGGDAVRILREEFAKHLQHVQSGIVEELETNTRKVLIKMSERLDYDDREDKKIFKDTLVTNVRDWHTHMAQYNEVLNIDTVSTLTRQVGHVLEMANPEVLRHSSEVRREVKTKVDAILKSMDW